MPDKGFKDFSDSPNFSDEWIDITLDEGSNIEYTNKRVTENLPIFYLMVTSIVIAVIIAGFIMLQIVKFIHDL